jgi:hypothetical protein
MELQRISPEKVTGGAAFIGRLLGLAALRCEPCRNKFFSMRPLWKAEEEGVAEQAATKY